MQFEGKAACPSLLDNLLANTTRIACACATDSELLLGGPTLIGTKEGNGDRAHYTLSAQ